MRHVLDQQLPWKPLTPTLTGAPFAARPRGAHCWAAGVHGQLTGGFDPVTPAEKDAQGSRLAIHPMLQATTW